MPIRMIMVPITGDGTGEVVLDHALAIGRRHALHVEVVYCQPPAESLIPFGVSIPNMLRQQIEESVSGVADSERDRIRHLLEEYVKTHGIDLVSDMGAARNDTLTMSWREERGVRADVIGRRGRLSDLIAVARPDRDRNVGTNTLQAALMSTGRPVMMCPPVSPTGMLGGHLAIAWNGSTESSRAVALSLSLLDNADRVTVLSAEGKTPPVSAKELLEYLSARGINAEIHTFAGAGAPIGRLLINETRKVGADMMVMGAYGKSHARETILGGATQTIVDESNIPVVMVH